MGRGLDLLRRHVQQTLNRFVDIVNPVVGDHSEIDRMQPMLQFLRRFATGDFANNTATSR